MRLFKFCAAALLISVFFFGCSQKHEFKETLSYEPSNPKPADEITVYYNPKGTPLENIDEIDMVAYLYSVDLDDAVGIEMKKEGEGYVGKFSTLPETRGVILKFVDRNENETLDADNKQGYRIILYGDDGKPVPGSEEGLAAAYYFWGPNAGMERDGNKALETFDKAFAENTDVKSEYLNSYLNVLLRVNPEQADSIAGQEAAQLEKKTDLTEDELTFLVNWFRRKDLDDKAQKYADIAIKKDPEGKFAQKELFNKFDETDSLNQKLEQLKAFEKEFPESEIKFDMYDELLFQYRKDGDYQLAYDLIKNNPNKVHPYYIYYLVDKMMTDSADSGLTLKIAEEGVNQAQANIDNPSRPRPHNETEKEWEKSRKYYLAMNQYVYGTLLHDNDSNDKALKVIEDAVANTGDENIQELNDLYGKLLVEQGKNEKAMAVISRNIKEGKGSPALKESLKQAYTNVKGTDKGFEDYLSEFEAAADADMLEHLKNEVLNEPAPGFTLTDLKGKEVSLSDYKGKVVIIDFWATWCGPCKQSFPAMKEAVEKYSNEAEFLFVNTWERVDNKMENAKKFIENTKYPFHVLVDQENKVITQYKVEGIPCKFIVGPDGTLKFKSVGYNGNPDELVKEIGMMIELAQK